MNIENITITSGPDEHEALAVLLRGLAAAENVELDYDDICAAMGVSFAAVSTTVEAAPGWWTTFGRDAFLEPAASLFGIELRDLHPPNVGVEMLTAEEFTQHFELSYSPLISGALANGEVVLAYQGWAEDHWPEWGAVTTERDGRFFGLVPGAAGEVELVHPAVQCYVVERCEPKVPGRGDLLEMAIYHGDALMNHAPLCPFPGETPVIVTGPQAYEAWEEWLTSGELDANSANEHCYHATCIAAARASGSRFLTQHREGLDPSEVMQVNGAITQCKAIVELLADACDVDAVSLQLADKAGRDELLKTLRLAQGLERKLASCFEQLA